MYCLACGNPITAGLSFCNRCGMNLKERGDSTHRPINAFLIAITLIGIVGLGIMLGGALTLKRDANLGEDIVGFFMFFTFLIVATTEILLVRQLSRLVREPKQIVSPPSFAAQHELPPAPARVLSEPMTSVTDNTTRTLEYARKESPAR